MAALLPQDGRRVIVHLGDFGIWPGADGRDYLSALDAALAAAGAELWFVDGNHEDFTQLARLRPGPDGREQVTGRIWHLPRGTGGAGTGGTGSPSAARSASTGPGGPPGSTGGPKRRSPGRRPGRSWTPGRPT